MKSNIFLIAALIPVVFIACENQVTERTTFKLGFKTTGNILLQEKSLRSATGEGILVDTAMIILEKIDIKPAGSTDTVYDPARFLLRGPYEVDLISAKSNPEIPAAEISPGRYDLLQGLLFKPAGQDFTIYISGTYTKDIQWWKFRYSYDLANVFRAKSSTGVEILENLSNNVWIMIDVLALFKGVDFTNTGVSSGNTILIDSVSNKTLWSIIEGNFKSAVVIDIGQGSSGGSVNDQAGSGQGNNDPGKATAGNDDNKDKDKNKDENKNKHKNKKKDKVNNKQKNKDKEKDKDEDKDHD